jgi:hypothetical protein
MVTMTMTVTVTMTVTMTMAMTMEMAMTMATTMTTSMTMMTAQDVSHNWCFQGLALLAIQVQALGDSGKGAARSQNGLQGGRAEFLFGGQEDYDCSRVAQEQWRGASASSKGA